MNGIMGFVQVVNGVIGRGLIHHIIDYEGPSRRWVKNVGHKSQVTGNGSQITGHGLP